MKNATDNVERRLPRWQIITVYSEVTDSLHFFVEQPSDIRERSTPSQFSIAKATLPFSYRRTWSVELDMQAAVCGPPGAGANA